MATYNKSISVNASVDTVRAILLDSGRLSEWHHLIRNVRDIDSEGFSATMSMIGTEIDFETLVESAEDAVTFNHAARKIEIVEVLTLTGHDDSTEVDYSVTSQGKGVFRLLGRGFVPVLERSVDKGLERLKVLSES
jgi:hypothetical protein